MQNEKATITAQIYLTTLVFSLCLWRKNHDELTIATFSFFKLQIIREYKTAMVEKGNVTIKTNRIIPYRSCALQGPKAGAQLNLQYFVPFSEKSRIV